jgi:predicted 3-demethylubiquinone-9 3-methyltransferase (glyoxalase superfamily)
MQKITPFLWFEEKAKQAAEFYVSIFENSSIKNINILENTPSGSVEIITFELMGQEFSFMSAGPFVKINPSISFTVTCSTTKKIDFLWTKLTKSGQILMELGEYPFSKKFGWIQDRYGISWQLNYSDQPDLIEKIIPSLMFVGENYGKAKEALSFYTSVFHKSNVKNVIKYGNNEMPDKEGNVKQAIIELEGQLFSIMESAYDHKFSFNESMSFVINCETQDEVDYYWDKLTAHPNSEQCGWLKDKYSVSWQVVPTGFNELMKNKDKDKVLRTTKAFLKMKKIDLNQLERIFNGLEN